jgi:hypothetical protein
MASTKVLNRVTFLVNETKTHLNSALALNPNPVTANDVENVLIIFEMNMDHYSNFPLSRETCSAIKKLAKGMSARLLTVYVDKKNDAVMAEIALAKSAIDELANMEYGDDAANQATQDSKIIEARVDQLWKNVGVHIEWAIKFVDDALIGLEKVRSALHGFLDKVRTQLSDLQTLSKANYVKNVKQNCRIISKNLKTAYNLVDSHCKGPVGSTLCWYIKQDISKAKSQIDILFSGDFSIGEPGATLKHIPLLDAIEDFETRG